MKKYVVVRALLIVVLCFALFAGCSSAVESPQYEYDSDGNVVQVTEYEDNGDLSCYYVYTYDSSGNIEGYTKYLEDGSVDFYTVYTYDTTFKAGSSTWQSSLYIEKFDADGTLKLVYIFDKSGNYDALYSATQGAFYAAISGMSCPLDGYLEND